MPELPEVETTLRGIQPYVDGATLCAVEVRNGSLRWPVPTKQIQSLLGAVIDRSWRRAKYILLDTKQGSLMLHLGMSGSVRMLPATNTGSVTKHDHIDLVFSKNGEKWLLRYNDPRRFGSLLFIQADHASFERHKHESHPLLAKLGPEPLSDDFDAELLFTQSRKRSIAVKKIIMNGHIVVGVGNIYANEALFLSNIRPTRAAGKVTRAEYQKLTTAIKQILTKAIQVGGTTLRDFTGSDGKAGYFQQTLNVYERDKKKCRQCDQIIKRIVIGQRSSFYCPACQK